MKRNIFAIIFAGCSIIGLQAQTDSIKIRLDSLMQDTLLVRTQLGLLVYDLTADSVLYGYGEKQTLRPASTMKLLTAVTALDQLGGNYQLRTSLRYKGTVSDRVLQGDLYCVGGMDPMFDDHDMDAFVEGVRALDVDTIRGRLVAVTSFKEDLLLGEGWCWDDDNPQLTPLLISRKDEFMQRFTDKLRQAGLVVEAEYATGSVPDDALSLSTRIHSLRDILVPMMKESDNLYAESVFFHIAASMGVRPAKAAHARQQIKKTLGKAGVKGVMYKIADGSGLSLYNYVTPELMVSLLKYAYRNTNISMYLYPSLSIAGQDGTLKKRMTGPVTNGRVHAKTGTLTGISSLAGYCSTSDGHQLAFCIINQGVMKNSEGREFQDRVCRALCE